MKKNEHPFAKPTRQSVFAIALIIVKYLRIIFRQLWPLLLIFLVGGSTSRKNYFLYGLIAIAVFSMIWAIIAYFKYTFYIKNAELVVEKGVLKRSKTSIPFGRIQTVNFQQNIIHQLLNVVQLDVDTAGSQNAEFSFDALSRESAHELREILLSSKIARSKEDESAVGEVENVFSRTHKLVLHLSPADLIKIGISQNHLRSGALIFAALFWIIESLGDVGFDTQEYIVDAFKEGLETSFIVLIVLLGLFLLVSFVISLFRTVVNYYDLKLIREENRYKLISGLFTRKERSAIDQKIQIIEWNDNLLKKLFKFYDVKLKQASSVQVSTKKSIYIPGCYYHHIDYLKKNWLGIEAFKALDKSTVSIHYFYRRFLYRALFSIVLILIFYYMESWMLLGLSIALIPYFLYTSWLSYKKAGFAVNDHILYVCKGMFGDDYSVMPLHKVQSLQIKQTPYQFRKSLSNLQIFTASGHVTIPYIPLMQALILYNYLLFKVESGHQSWM